MSESRLSLEDVAAPVYTADHDQCQEWHRRVVEAVFQFGFEQAGFVHMVGSSPRDVCGVCGCGPAKDGCWYCPTVEGVAA